MTTVTINNIPIKVDDAWDSITNEDYETLGTNGYDVAAYMSDGCSIWPCGRTVDADEGTGTDYCTCKTCQNVRHALNPEPKYTPKKKRAKPTRTGRGRISEGGS